jgi:hypothetical protein
MHFKLKVAVAIFVLSVSIFSGKNLQAEKRPRGNRQRELTREDIPRTLEKAELEALNRGEVPARLKEEYRMVELGPDQARFQTFLAGLVRTVFRKAFDRNGIRFFLFEDNEPNAWALLTPTIPVVFTSTGLLKRSSYLEHVVWTESHEWVHIYLERRLGAGNNSKGEEYTADIYPLAPMESAGFDPRVISSFAGEILYDAKKKGSTKFLDVLPDIVDVHGVPINREEAIKKRVLLLDYERGETPNLPTPLPQEIYEWRDLKHFAVIPTELERRGFDGLDVTSKLNTLSEVVPLLIPWHRARLSDFAKAMKGINPPQHVIPEMSALVDKLVQTAIQTSEDESETHLISNLIVTAERMSARTPVPTGRSETVRYPARPLLGIFKIIGDAMTRFIEARNMEQALAAAQNLNHLLETCGIPEDLLMIRNWPTFFLPLEYGRYRFGRSLREMFVSWNPHLAWANEDESLEILRALWRMGVEDPRMYALIPKEELPDYLGGKFKPINNKLKTWQRHQGNFIIDEVGRLSWNKDLDVQLDADRRRIVALAEQRAEALAPVLRDLFYRAMGGDREAERKFHLCDDMYTLNNKGDGISLMPFAFGEPLGIEILDPDNWEFFAYTQYYVIQGADTWAPDSDMQTLWKRAIVARFNTLLERGGNNYRNWIKKLFAPSDDLSNFNVTSLMSGTLNDPFAQFLLVDKHHLFSPKDTLLFLEDASIKELLFHSLASDDNEVQKKEESDRVLFGDYSQVFRALQINPKPVKISELTTAVQILHKYDLKLARQLAAVLLIQYEPEDKRENLSVDTLAQLLPLVSLDTVKMTRGLIPAFMKIVSRNDVWPSQSTQFASHWKALNEAGLFPEDGVLKESLLNRLVKLIASGASNRIEQRESIEILLGKGGLEFPVQRARLTQLWVQTCVEEIGKDDKSPRYLYAITRHADRIAKTLSRPEAMVLLRQLAKAVEAQYEVACALRKRETRESRKDLEKTYLWGILVEGLLDLCKRSDNLRHGITEFFVHALTQVSSDRFLDTLDSVINKVGDPSVTLRRKSPLFNRDASLEARDFQVRLLYENFWDRSRLERTLVIDQLLLPPEKQRDLTSYAEVLTFALSEIFPRGMKYAEQARRLFTEYLKILPKDHRVPFISAVLVANKRIQGSTETLSVGKRMSVVLTGLGPAEKKLVQGAHSYSRTPEDIREDIGDSKTMTDVPERKEAMQWYEDVVPEHIKNNVVVHVGEIIGAASYEVVFRVTVRLPDGTTEDQALAIERPYSERLANTGFKRLKALAQSMGESDPIYNDFVHLIEQAHESSIGETDWQAKQRKARVATSLFEGFQVKINDKPIDFSFAKTFATGPRYRFMPLVTGTLFNKLSADKVEEGDAQTWEYGLSNFVHFLFLTSCGLPFCNDRHGGQVIASKRQNNHLDPGGFSESKQPDEDMRVFAELLHDLLVVQKKDSVNVVDLFVERLKHFKEKYPAQKKYLTRLERGLLAHKDFLKTIPPSILTEALPEILRAISQTGYLHPEIQKRLRMQILALSFLPRSKNCAVEIILSNFSPKVYPPSRN